jgi:hypothetical protein
MNDKVHMRKTLLDTYFTILPLSVCSLFIKTMRRIMRKILISIRYTNNEVHMRKTRLDTYKW